MMMMRLRKMQVVYDADEVIMKFWKVMVYYDAEDDDKDADGVGYLVTRTKNTMWRIVT